MADFLLEPDAVIALVSAGGDREAAFVEHAAQRSDGIWVYVGAAQGIRAGVAATLASTDQPELDAGERIGQFMRPFNWLAALAEDGECISEADPQAAQQQKALGRLSHGARMIGANGISVDDYLALETENATVPFIDLAYQQRLIRPKVERGLFGVLSHGRYIGGDEIGELESRLADYCGVKNAIAVSNGTDALLIALLAVNVKPGDEVITSPFTFAATGEMILLLGAKPVYVDIDPVSYNLDPAQLEGAITERTRAIIPVSIFGQCADMDPINRVAAEHGLAVIEDAAQSFGASYNGKRSGALCDIACTSFFPSKPLGGYGDSGACFTDNDELAEAIGQIRDHGQTGRYQHTRLGLNGRMSSFQASVLLAKLDLFYEEAKLRSDIGDRYTSLLVARGAGESLDVVPPRLLEGNVSVYAQYSVLVNDRDNVQKKLQAAGVPSAVHYPIPLNQQPAMCDENCKVPVAEDVSKRVLSLPMHPYIRESEQVRVIDALVDAVSD